MNLVKLNQGKIRLSVFNELGTGPSTLGFGWYSSNATMMSVSLHKLYKEYGVSFSNGYEVSYLNSPAGTEKWSGFNSYRIGVLYSDYLEIYGHMNYDMEDEFRNIITLELGVKYYLDFL